MITRRARGLRRSLCVVVVCLWVQSALAYQITELADGLEFPWCVAFLPNGDLLVTERNGALRLVHDGQLSAEPIKGVPPVYVRSQGGLFDVLVHPNFAENGFVYLSFAHGDVDGNATRVLRARFDGSQLLDPEIIFEVTPSKRGPVHYGGRLLFLPDGTLLITTGDGFDYREQAQNLASLLGKTVRLNDDGSVPSDNPFVGQVGYRPEIWTYGHRNPQGLALDRDTSRVYLHEHGPRGGDELNLIEPGKNYGWPAITYGIDYSGAKISPYQQLPGMEQPLKYWVPSNAPAGMTYYAGDRFPKWHGDLFISTLVDQDVKRLQFDKGQIISEQSLFAEIGARIRDVRAGPRGYLYLLTDENPGRLLRVEP